MIACLFWIRGSDRETVGRLLTADWRRGGTALLPSAASRSRIAHRQLEYRTNNQK